MTLKVDARHSVLGIIDSFLVSHHTPHNQTTRNLPPNLYYRSISPSLYLPDLQTGLISNVRQRHAVWRVCNRSGEEATASVVCLDDVFFP